jgi:hypothetical protein
LVKIWGGSANTEPLSFGVSSERLNSEGDGHQDLQSEFESQDSDSRSNASGAQKRKATENAVPKLVDNKRKHLEKNLSAAKRDKILINEGKGSSSKFHGCDEGVKSMLYESYGVHEQINARRGIWN